MRWIDPEGVPHDERAAVRAALTAHLNDAEAMAGLYRTAETCARVPCGSLVARELVWDVVSDVFVGEVTCDLTRALAGQLDDLVRRRANRLRRAERETVFVPLGTAPPSALLDEEAAEGDEDSTPDVAELVAWIRAYAPDDDAVQQLLTLYVRGRVLRREALRTGMKPWVYRAARVRLTAYARLAAAAAGRRVPGA